MSAPPPIVKESLGGDSGRLSQMVTLKRGGKTGNVSLSESSKGKPAASSEVANHAAPSDSSAETKASDRPTVQKKSPWQPLTNPSTQEQTETADSKERVPATDAQAGRSERSKVSPTYSDEKPPVKRYREEKTSRGGRNAGTERLPASRRGSSRPREFTRTGGAVSRGGGSSRMSGGHSYPSQGSRMAAVPSRGRGRGRGSYDIRSNRQEYVTAQQSDRPERSAVSDGSRKQADVSAGNENLDQPVALNHPADGQASDNALTRKASEPPTDDTSDNSSQQHGTKVGEAPLPEENIWDKRKQEMGFQQAPVAEASMESVRKDDMLVGGAAAGPEKDGKNRGSRDPRNRPTRGTYVAPRGRSKGGQAPRFNNASSRYVSNQHQVYRQSVVL